MNSMENGGRVNGDNIAFLIGAERVGKSSYVENNIEKFKQLKRQLNDRMKKPVHPVLHALKTPEYV